MAQAEPNLDHDISWVLLPSYWAKIVVGLISFLCFANSYDGDFVFDDSEAIINNKVCLFCFVVFFPFDLNGNRKRNNDNNLSRPKIFILMENFLLIFPFLNFIFVCFSSKPCLQLTNKLCRSVPQKNQKHE